jgi:hypothetical protein
MGMPDFSDDDNRRFDEWWNDPSATANSLPMRAIVDHLRIAFQAGFEASEAAIMQSREIHDRDRRTVKAIDTLREQEGEAVQIPNDNPDFGGPNCVIIWHRDFGDDEGVRFPGDTLLECLEKAVAARSKLRGA